MKNKFSKYLAAVALLAFSLTAANASPILVAYTTQIPTQPANNGLQTIENWASASVVTYNNLNNPDLPAVPASLPTVVNQGDVNPFGSMFDSNTKSIDLDLTGYTGYLVLAWGGAQTPLDPGTADFLYYVTGDQTDSFNNNFPLAKGGLSSIHYWGTTTVPDGGTTALMLGLGLVALALVGYRRQAVKA